MAELKFTFSDLAKNGDMTFGDGYRTKKSEHGKPGLPILRVAEVHDGGIKPEFADYVSDSYREAMGVKISRVGDVVLTTKGTVGRVAIIPNGMPEFVYSPQVCFFRVTKGSKLEVRYLYYWFRSSEFWGQARSRKSQTDMADYLNLTDIRSLSITLPDLMQQQGVVAVLGALDDKITVNERIATTAGELSRAKMAALWRSLGVSSLTVDPGFSGPDVRRMTLAEMCSEHGGGIQTGPFGSQLHASDYVEFGTPSVMPQNIGENSIIEDGIARVAPGDVERLSKYALSAGDIVYSRRGDVKRRALVREYESGWLCGTGCLRVRLGDSSKSLFMSLYLGEREVQDWILQHSVGATMPNLNTSILGAVPVVLPSQQLMDRVSAELAPLDARSTQGMHESRTLAALRDTLLPQLMSGRLRVRDAERIVEDAV